MTKPDSTCLAMKRRCFLSGRLESVVSTSTSIFGQETRAMRHNICRGCSMILQGSRGGRQCEIRIRRWGTLSWHLEQTLNKIPELTCC